MFIDFLRERDMGVRTSIGCLPVCAGRGGWTSSLGVALARNRACALVVLGRPRQLTSRRAWASEHSWFYTCIFFSSKGNTLILITYCFIPHCTHLSLRRIMGTLPPPTNKNCWAFLHSYKGYVVKLLCLKSLSIVLWFCYYWMYTLVLLFFILLSIFRDCFFKIQFCFIIM